MTIRVQLRENHFVVLAANGDEVLTSKEYASDASAKRAATNFYEKVTSGDVTLEEGEWEGTAKEGRWTKGTVLSEGAPKSEPTPLRAKAADSPYATGQKIEVPQAGGPLHATNPLATGVVDES
jgi:hypothetical protein